MQISYVVQPRYVTAWNKSVSNWSDEDTIVSSYAQHLGLTSLQASSMNVNETGWNNKICKLYAHATTQTLPASSKASKKKRKSFNEAFITPEDISLIVNRTTFQVLTHKLPIQNETTTHNFLSYSYSTSTLGTSDLVLRLDEMIDDYS
jgi:hypothetical protein